MSGEAKAPSTLGTGDFDKQLGRAELSEPESDMRRRRVLAVLEVVGLHESPDHRPVLVALRLLGSDQVGQRHEIEREPVGQGDRHDLDVLDCGRWRTGFGSRSRRRSTSRSLPLDSKQLCLML